jgi:NADH-quinone oxidoreductase subunit M
MVAFTHNKEQITNMADISLLSVLIWLPILGGIWVLFVESSAARPIALAVSLITFLISLPLYFGFNVNTYEMQFTETIAWIPALSINYQLGIDGFSMPLIILTTFTMVLVILAGWEVIKYKPAQYMAAF